MRLSAVWLGVAVLVLGNVADWLGWIGWGPEQQVSDQRYWVLASAAGFWIAVSTLITLVVDSWYVLRGQPVPTSPDLDRSGPFRGIGNWVRKTAVRHHALLGVGGLVLGAVVGHLFWKP